MNRREFLNKTAAAAGVVAALRAGDVHAAEAAAAVTEEATGLKHTIYVATDYGMKGDGSTDNVGAITDLFVRANTDLGGKYHNAAVTYFFPAGRYLFSGPIYMRWDKVWGPPDMNLNYICQYIGQGPLLTQFVLQAGAEGFQDPETPRPFLAYGLPDKYWGECLGMLTDSIAVLASEEGSNPGSHGMMWWHHFGVHRNIVVSAGHTCWILRWSPLEVLENIVCLGGRYGIVADGGRMWQTLSCLGFTEAGVRLMSLGCQISGSIRGLHTRGQGPGVRVEYNDLSVVNARLEADPPGQEAAVVHHHGTSSFVMLETSGYQQLVKDEVPAAGEGINVLSFYASHNHILPPPPAPA